MQGDIPLCNAPIDLGHCGAFAASAIIQLPESLLTLNRLKAPAIDQLDSASND